jgi:2,3-diaminopropionate biosynthesis protein SbnA
MAPVKDGIVSVIGNTPLIKLNRVFKDINFDLYAKLECLNPGGSTKDRSAISIIEHGLASGTIRPGTVVIESSSGNMGIGLAQACSYYNLSLICVVDPKTTQQNLNLLQAYGATVDMVTEPDPQSGEFLQARIDRVQELLRSTENSFWCNQYANPHNALAHEQTMHEIATALDDKVDYLFCATSTCGTMRGCSDYVKRHRLKTTMIAVDAIGSVIFGGEKAKRLIPGHGAAMRPQLYRDDLADDFVLVSDLSCVVGCRRLMRTESLLAGGSSGAVVAAIEQLRFGIPKGSTCVGIFADRGERYLDTIYSDTWVRAHFGDVAHLWTDPVEVAAYV